MMNYEEMPASRPLDIRVAEDVFGYDASQIKFMPTPCPDGMRGCAVVHRDRFFANGQPLPKYSTDLAAAWQIITWWRDPEKVGGYGELLIRCEGAPETGLWIVELGRFKGVAQSLPLAICRAGLQAARG